MKWFCLLFLLPLACLRAAEPGPADPNAQTLSPYFFIPQQGADHGTSDPLPLKSTEVDVKIAGVIADVRVTQVYANAGSRPIEAIYIVPGSTRAAVYGMEMTIGDRVLKAQVKPREEARQTYESAKAEGKSTSLLEQQRPNVFQMNVANILPGDTVKVELRYTETLVPEAGEYSFVFPTVVGPRYSNTPAAGAPDTAAWVQNPYLKQGAATPSTFQLTAEITAGMPIQDLRCPSHQLTPEFLDASSAVVRQTGQSGPGNDRDFILKYRLADSKIEGGLLLSKGDKENFYLLTVQPPKRITPAQIPPREYIFVIDVSGSMDGFPLDTSKELIRKLLGTLRTEDRFNVLLFAGGSTLMAPTSQPATAQNLRSAIDLIERQRGGGGTELLPALKRALAIPVADTTARSIVVITDGYVSLEAESFDLIRNNLNRANLFAFGIGSSVNRFLIEGMARAGQGEPFIVTRPDEAAQQAQLFQEYISAPVLTRVQVEAEGFAMSAMEPATVADVLAERPIVVMGKWTGEAQGTITVRGITGAGEFLQSFPVASAKVLEGSPALSYLWARSRIATLGDNQQLRANDENVRQITNLGLTYNLLTAYTSFVAVDDRVRNPGGQNDSVKQPLPLPQGVSNQAVGGAAVATTPEPETWMLLIAGTVLMVLHLRSRKIRLNPTRSCA